MFRAEMNGKLSMIQPCENNDIIYPIKVKFKRTKRASFILFAVIRLMFCW